MNIEKVLTDRIAGYQRVLVAFSGGVDSTFLLYLCRKVLGKENVLAVSVNSSMLPQWEKKDANDLAKQIDAEHIWIEANEYTVPELVANGPDRCYYCKKHIFLALKELAKKRGFLYVVDGSNLDDASDYRPGHRALRELSIESPLRDVTKQEIRAMCRAYGLPVADKPSYACLASRIAYGEIITKERLQRVEKSESWLMKHGFSDVRVRDYAHLARIELLKDQRQKACLLADEIEAAFKSFGYTYVTLDFGGRRTGSMNDVLKDEGKRHG